MWTGEWKSVACFCDIRILCLCVLYGSLLWTSKLCVQRSSQQVRSVHQYPCSRDADDSSFSSLLCPPCWIFYNLSISTFFTQVRYSKSKEKRCQTVKILWSIVWNFFEAKIYSRKLKKIPYLVVGFRFGLDEYFSDTIIKNILIVVFSFHALFIL